MTTLDIFSDPVCPFCLIGKSRLERAMAVRPDHGFSVVWHPFQLNPTMPKAGLSRADYLEAKFGQAGAVKMTQQIMDICKAEGVELNILGVLRQPNTLDAHRLIHWAGLEERQGPVVDAIMRAFWVEGRDIGNATVLAEIAQSCGMERAMVERLLASDSDIDEITARDQYARQRGIKAVPTFVIGNQHAVEGAQPAELWLKVIEDLQGVAPSLSKQ
ncbi:DsbA family oxidoreductase [Thioclava sp. A2]|uniref:DsbA family oxidoreductase n=1 Tax=Thioclava sp. FCG-A2 TaxID=3080562 RepID=UPI0029542A24|nr:DsbA family oxidoreductase [Thioclava sp. A2]MDV7269696.1 DsbA family oxidoreductase [Thioclava sp. A2]